MFRVGVNAHAIERFVQIFLLASNEAQVVHRHVNISSVCKVLTPALHTTGLNNIYSSLTWRRGLNHIHGSFHSFTAIAASVSMRRGLPLRHVLDMVIFGRAVPIKYLTAGSEHVRC